MEGFGLEMMGAMYPHKIPHLFGVWNNFGRTIHAEAWLHLADTLIFQPQVIWALQWPVPQNISVMTFLRFSLCLNGCLLCESHEIFQPVLFFELILLSGASCFGWFLPQDIGDPVFLQEDLLWQLPKQVAKLNVSKMVQFDDVSPKQDAACL